VADAIGVPIRTLPLTPERLVRAVREGEAAAAPNIDPSFDLRPGEARDR
jgi:hypothetical protein